MSVFPFGWVEDRDEENWQILWASESGRVFLKAAVSGRTVEAGSAPLWTDAKRLADDVKQDPIAFLGASLESTS